MASLKLLKEAFSGVRGIIEYSHELGTFGNSLVTVQRLNRGARRYCDDLCTRPTRRARSTTKLENGFFRMILRTPKLISGETSLINKYPSDIAKNIVDRLTVVWSANSIPVECHNNMEIVIKMAVVHNIDFAFIRSLYSILTPSVTYLKSAGEHINGTTLHTRDMNGGVSGIMSQGCSTLSSWTG